MATVFVAPPPAGDDSRSYAVAQVAATPWATIEKPIASAVAGDTVSIVDGTYNAPAAPGFYSFTKLLLNVAQTERAAIWRADAAFNTYIARISSSAGAGTFTADGILFDGQSRVATGFEVGADDTDVWTTNILDCLVQTVTMRAINIFGRIGTVNIDNLTYSGSASQAGIINGNLDAGAVAAQVMAVNFTDCSITLAASGAAEVNGINFQASGTRLSAVTPTITDCNVAVTSNAASFAQGIKVLGCDATTITGGTVTIISAGASESGGIYVFGKSASATANDAVIDGVVVRGNFAAGHGIQLGASTSATNNMTGGTVSGCRVSNVYFGSATPHNITLGRGTTGTATGNISEDAYVGILTSMTTTASVYGNVIRDCYGPSLYAKGTTAATISGNSCYLTGLYVQRDLGILAATYQGAVDCTAATFSNNIVFVSDVSRIHALASISGLAADANTPQPVTFTNNTYYIPDTVDITTALLFVYEGALGAAANQTYAQWEANAEVTGDRVIQLPQAVINSIISGSSRTIMSFPLS